MWARVITNVLSPEEIAIGRFRTVSLDAAALLETSASLKNVFQPSVRIGLSSNTIRSLQPKHVDSIGPFTTGPITWARASSPVAALQTR
jgi:hypothetical protein